MKIYNVSKSQVYSSCMLSAISHAIMTNKYPDLSYEQSWDDCNYLMNNEKHRITVSFTNDYCVGAVRDYTCNGYAIKNIDGISVDEIPLRVKQILTKETLQYLLENKNGIKIPVVSSIFWCNAEKLFFLSLDNNSNESDFNFILFCAMKLDKCLKYWTSYYEMNNDEVALILSLYEKRKQELYLPVFLDKKQIIDCTGKEIDEECIISLEELNIFLT